MLKRGIFGGTYFSCLIDPKNFPDDWFEGLDESFYLSDNYLSGVNYFKVKSGQSQKEWEANKKMVSVLWTKRSVEEYYLFEDS